MKLLDARLDLDTRCNYRCVYCQNRMTRHPSPPWFELDALGAVAPVLNRHCWSVFLSCGGEPTLHPRFIEALQVASDRLRGADVSLVTNGYILDRNSIAAMCDAGLTRISFSMDTIDEVLYQSLCGSGPGAIGQVKRNVEETVRARKGRAFPRVFVTSIAMKRTLSKLVDLAEWAGRIGVDGLRVQWLSPYDTPGMEDDVVGLEPDTVRIFRRVARVCRRAGVYFEYPYTASWAKFASVLQGARFVKNKLPYLVSSAIKFARSQKKGACRIGGLTFRLRNDGQLVYCQYDVVRMPNILKEPDVNLARVFAAATKAHTPSSSSVCRECQYYRP